jgi:hypothetical protein
MMRAIAVLLALCATPALAQDRPFCADRPGLATEPCTLAPGRFMVETGLIDWTRDDQGDERTDQIGIGGTLLRYGVTQRLELQFGWDAYQQNRTRDAATGMVTHRRGAGDILFAARRSVSGPQGPVAAMAFVTLPLSRDGAGTWGAGVLIPVALDLGHEIELDLTPEIDAQPDGDGQGRHPAFGGVAGMTFAVSRTIAVSAEISLFRDHDPAGFTTEATGALSLSWQAGDNLQFDAEADAGLNAATPTLTLRLGIARRF